MKRLFLILILYFLTCFIFSKYADAACLGYDLVSGGSILNAAQVLGAKTTTGASGACFVDGSRYSSITVTWTGTAVVKWQCLPNDTLTPMDFTDVNGTITKNTSPAFFGVSGVACKWIYANLTTCTSCSATVVCNVCF